jgi:murein DD-endopeptidase MepM/ murein hydrolase activator NlpD
VKNASGIILLVLLLVYCEQKEATTLVEQSTFEADSIVNVDTVDRFKGIPLTNRITLQGKVRWNQTLSKILDTHNVKPEVLYTLDRNSRKVYDVRKLKAGSQFTIVKDTVRNKATHFVFEPDALTTVIYHLDDTVMATAINKPVKLVEQSIAVAIKGSVYESVLEAGGSPLLSSKLVDILAWQVDFFKIQAGDRFKVIYTEEQVEGKTVGISRIDGVYFEHLGRTYYGIFFDESEGREDYFDEKGNSMRKTFLRTPLDFGRMTSRFSPRRYHPVLRRFKAHLGTDYAAPVGTPIRTVGEGIVLEAKYGKYNGNFVKIKHNSNYSTQYLHMSKIKAGIRPGVKVKQGQTIGFVGQTGLANGPHVCYRFWKNGRQVDPQYVDLPPSEPINPSLLSTYLHHKNVLVHRLGRVEFAKTSTESMATTVE